MVWLNHGLVWFGFARGLAVVFDLVRFGSLKLSYIQNHGVLILRVFILSTLLSSVLYVRANMFCIKFRRFPWVIGKNFRVYIHTYVHSSQCN